MTSPAHILFLDDDSTRHRDFTRFMIGFSVHVTGLTTAAQAIDWLRTNQPDICCLDHDLTAEHYEACAQGRFDRNSSDTGMAVVRHLIQTPRRPMVIVHTWHDLAAETMTKELRRAGFYCLRQHFDPDLTPQAVRQCLERWSA